MIEGEQQTTLRDTVASLVDKVEAGEPLAPVPDAPPVKTDAAVEPVETEEQKAGRTANRLRDDKGRLMPGKAEPKPGALAEAPKPETAAVPAVPRPSSWKKDYEGDWAKLPPNIQKYLTEREGQFASGVSTYKSEADKAKTIIEALSPYQPFLQQNNIKPDEFVRGLAETDRVLRFGTKEDKLRAFSQFAKDYQIPLHEMLVQGEDGKIYFNQEYAKPAPQQAPAGVSPHDIERHVESAMHKAAWLQSVKNFREAKDASGNPLHPHVAEVETTMAGLLRSGVVNDLDTAYQVSLSMPQHSALKEAEQKHKLEAEAQEKSKALVDAAKNAKANAVSTKSATPAVKTTGAKSGIRASIEDAVNRAEGGRV